MTIGIKTHILTHSSSLPERCAPGSEARWVNIILSHAPLKHSDGSLLKRTSCTLFKAVYEQSLTRSPWPRCDNGGKKKSSSIFGSVCQSCDEIPDWERERGSEHNARVWSDRSIPFRTSRWNTKRKVSWHEGQTFCRKVYQIYFSVSSVWWARRSHFERTGSEITRPDLQCDELQRPETYWPLRAIWGYFMCN